MKTHIRHFNKWWATAAALLLTVSSQAFLPMLLGTAEAGTFTKTLVRFDSMSQSTSSTGTVCFAPTVTTAINAVKVTFPTGFTLAVIGGGNWTANATSTNAAWPSGATGLTNVTAADNITGQVVRFPLSAGFTPTAGNVYCFNWAGTASVTQPSSPGSDEQGTVASYSDTGGTTQIDSASYSTATISNDQITVTATVPQTFSLAIGGCASNTDGLGQLSPSGPSTSGSPCTATINTNAKNGWQAWAKDANVGLKSTTAGNHVIPSNCSSGAGTNTTINNTAEGYNLGIETSQDGTSLGTITQNGVFSRSSTPYKGGGLCATFQTLATSSGTASNAVITMYNSASITGSTPAANDYTDTETVVAAGLF
jgi:hypothetical protein